MQSTIMTLKIFKKKKLLPLQKKRERERERERHTRSEPKDLKLNRLLFQEKNPVFRTERDRVFDLEKDSKSATKVKSTLLLSLVKIDSLDPSESVAAGISK